MSRRNAFTVAKWESFLRYACSRLRFRFFSALPFVNPKPSKGQQDESLPDDDDDLLIDEIVVRDRERVTLCAACK